MMPTVWAQPSLSEGVALHTVITITLEASEAVSEQKDGEEISKRCCNRCGQSHANFHPFICLPCPTLVVSVMDSVHRFMRIISPTVFILQEPLLKRLTRTYSLPEHLLILYCTIVLLYCVLSVALLHSSSRKVTTESQ